MASFVGSVLSRCAPQKGGAQKISLAVAALMPSRRDRSLQRRVGGNLRVGRRRRIEATVAR